MVIAEIRTIYQTFIFRYSGLKVDENGIASFTINHNQKCTVSTSDGYNNDVIAKPDMKNALMVANTSTAPTDDVVSLSFKPIMTTLEIVVQGPTTNINSSNARVTGICIAATMKTNDRCRECPGLALVLQRFPISWGELGNCCKDMPFYANLCAAIRDFMG